MEDSQLRALQGRLDIGLRRTTSVVAHFRDPQPPFDLEEGEECRELWIAVTKHFAPENLEAVCANEQQMLALTSWALHCLLAKPYIVQYHSHPVRWRWMSLPEVKVTAERPERISLEWGWRVQFCAPIDSGNVYLEKMGRDTEQMSLF